MPLTPQLLLAAYSQGVFPMAHPEEENAIYWYDPDPRTILPLENFTISRRLARTVRSGKYHIVCNAAFEAVMRACALPTANRPTTWISEDFIKVYSELHRQGFAHSVECYYHGQLIGGLYGVAIGGLFAGESMFSFMTDASKVALVHLVNCLQAGGYQLLDVQFSTTHLQQFGIIEIPRSDYKQRLTQALTAPAHWPSVTG